jgi:prephenate dehydratase
MNSHPTVAIQGQAASFHDVAARKYFGDDISTIFCDLPFRLVFDALEEGRADYAVCAIENSLHGTINDVYDLLQVRPSSICGEVFLHIEQCLIGLPGATLADITEVYSHPVALSQCEDFLDTSLPHAARFERDDTAGSVADIAASGDKHKAAIASAAAAQLHGMQILQRGVETNHHNFTRFVVLTREQPNQDDSNKTSIVVEAPNQPGSLHKALGAFAARGLNLTLLTSRPIVGKPQSYMFYMDFAGGLQETRTREAIGDIKDMGCAVTILGSYKAATMPEF